MILRLDELAKLSCTASERQRTPTLIHDTAMNLPALFPFQRGVRADLVVTSPPYPGIHMLYHRWQVDGRKETPAPYWIAGCMDGHGSTFYNFAGRKSDHENDYFDESLRTLSAVRAVMKKGAYFVQMIAFSRPRTQLPRYLQNMVAAGFEEVLEAQNGESAQRFRRIWRAVPNRAWYANLKGSTASSREVVLIHRAK